MSGTQSLERAFLLLRVIATAGQRGASLDELRLAAGCSQATAYRLLQYLRRQGFVRGALQRGRYVLGYELFALGAQAGNASTLRERARPVLLRLAQRFGDSFFLLVADGHQVLCLDMLAGTLPVQSYSGAVGGRIPMGVGQASQVLLAWLGRSERNGILAHNAATLRLDYGLEVQRITASLPSVKRLGYASGLVDKRLPGYTGLAVPILDASGQPLGALSCALARPRMTDVRREALAQVMKEEAQRLVQALPAVSAKAPDVGVCGASRLPST
ncbi:IclR family transcriptional regulator [Ectopseudomonas composti]|uniref:IclR family transcriptional regulator n=1 Tax=Ectopseudomonas composti TaxID=658457 RepID=A0ABN0S982_9GAMM|nr:IclR family transcriptional regulator [Pseudomonas composti]EZH78726.1 IclR family transcriptional regulator [Pseudomonas composti]